MFLKFVIFVLENLLNFYWLGKDEITKFTGWFNKFIWLIFSCFFVEFILNFNEQFLDWKLAI
jgi:hypothetical protein